MHHEKGALLGLPQRIRDAPVRQFRRKAQDSRRLSDDCQSLARLVLNVRVLHHTYICMYVCMYARTCIIRALLKQIMMMFYRDNYQTI
jgi:hypothetical protein